MEIWKSSDGSEIGVLAATWELHPRITFESLAEEFRRNPGKAWRNYGSVVRHNVEAAIRDPEVLLRVLNTARHCPWDYDLNQFHPWFRGRAGYRYFIHFDLSESRDATGVAITHRERREHGKKCSVVDFMLRISAPLGKNIDYGRLRKDFVYEVASRGFVIGCVTYDNFQSAESRQVLTEKGFEVDEVSADKTTKPYDTVIEQILGSDGATTPEIDYYNYPVFLREMRELRLVNGRKYDHPVKSANGDPGSKDVSDAVAASIWKAIEYELKNPEPVAGALLVHRNTRPATYGERSRF